MQIRVKEGYDENKVLMLLDKFKVSIDQVTYTDENGQKKPIPLECLYFGKDERGHRMYIGSPHLLRYPDGHVIQDSYGKRITVGNWKRGIVKGMYDEGNREAYNAWVIPYAIPKK